MEQEFIFKLKRALVLPVSEWDNQGMLVYNPRDFALGYSTVPNPKEKQLTVNLLIYRLSDERTIRNLATFVITEQGFPTGRVLNQAEIDAAATSRADLEQETLEINAVVADLYLEEAALNAEGQDTTAISKQITDLIKRLAEIRVELNALIVPTPELEYYNRYSDIIDYFNKDGSITELGIEWARTVPFMGLTLNDYLA